VAQLVSAGGLTTSCKVEIRKGMSFDLSPLRQGTLSPNGVYVADKATMYSVNDTAGGGVGREYLYNFNFCGAVEPTAQCKAKGADIPLPAFQSDVAENGFCYRLSNQTKLGWQFEAYGEPAVKAGSGNAPPFCHSVPSGPARSLEPPRSVLAMSAAATPQPWLPRCPQTTGSRPEG